MGEARWERRHWAHPTPPINRVKIHLLVVLLSLKTGGWRSSGIFSSSPPKHKAESLFYNQGCQERSTRSQVRRRNDHVGTYTTSRGHRRGGGCHKLGDTPYGVRDSSYMFGTAGLEIWHWEDESPHLVWKSVGSTIGAMRNWDFIMKSIHTHFLTPRNMAKKAY